MARSLSTAAVLALLGHHASAHMIMNFPPPYGHPDNSPLDSSGANYPCKFDPSSESAASFYSGVTPTTMAQGETQTLSFNGSAVHGGGTCQLAVTSDPQPSQSTSWQVIQTIQGGCPTVDGTGPSTYPFSIPDSIAPGNYVFAWSWVSKLSGGPEYYMNCGPITVTAGSSSKRSTKESTALAKRDSLPNLTVLNLESINSCKSVSSSDPVYPDPGPNVVKPSKMTTNYQPITGTNCFPVGDTSSSSNTTSSSDPSPSSGSDSGSGSGSDSGSGSGSDSGSGSSTASSAAAPASTSSASSTASGSDDPSSGSGSGSSASASAPGGVFFTAPGASTLTTSVVAATSAADPTSPVETTSAISAAPAATGTGTSSAGSTTGGGNLSGACTDEGTFNCVGGSQYQQCASGAWSVMMPMPAGTQCQEGFSTTLWANSKKLKLRSVRRLHL